MKYLGLGLVICMFFSCASKTDLKQPAEQTKSQQQTVAAANDKKQTQDQAVQVKDKAESEAAAEQKIIIKRSKSNVEQGDPLMVIENYTKQLRSFVDIPNSKEKENSIAEQVREYFDFQELAKRSLGSHWNKQSQANRDTFSKLFIELVETSYLKRSRQIIGGYEVVFKDQKITGQTASVTSSITQEDADIDIRYDLLKKQDRWLIYNITLDDVNLIRTYQSQFNKIINDEGFSHLIDLMKKRAAVKDKDDIQL